MNVSRELKEALAYVLGGIGFLHELFISNAERPFLLTASLALMGFPLVFKADEKLRSPKRPSDPDVEPTHKSSSDSGDGKPEM